MSLRQTQHLCECVRAKFLFALWAGQQASLYVCVCVWLLRLLTFNKSKLLFISMTVIMGRYLTFSFSFRGAACRHFVRGRVLIIFFFLFFGLRVASASFVCCLFICAIRSLLPDEISALRIFATCSCLKLILIAYLDAHTHMHAHNILTHC